MSNKKIIGTILVVFIISSFIIAQERKVTKIELPQLTLEQKRDTAAGNLYAFIIVGIAYAKSLEKTPEEYGEFIGRVFAPGWEDSKGKGVAALIIGMCISRLK